MSDQFNVRHADFSQFERLYRDDILPELIIKDMERRRLVSQFYKVMAVLTVGLVTLIIFLVLKFPYPLGFFAGIASYIGGAIVAYRHLGKLKASTKGFLVTKICGLIGWSFKQEGFDPLPLEDFIGLGMLTTPDRSKFEDQMSGLAHGVNFVMHEAHLEREQGGGKDKRWVTTFRGVLIRIDFPRKFLGRTIILRDAGMFNRKKKKGLDRVGLVDPKFEKIFEAYGNDQVEARYLLTPTFMQKLVDLENLLEGKKLRAGFLGGQLLIAVNAPNQFEAGSMFKPLTDGVRTQKILDEIGTVLDIVDGVRGG